MTAMASPMRPNPVCRDLQKRQRIVLGSVEAQGNHQHVGIEFANSGESIAKTLHEDIVTGTSGEGNVNIATAAVTLTDFLPVAGEKRIELRRIAVQRDRHHIAALVENSLGAVSMVHVHIDDGDPGGAVVAAILGRDGGVVEKAKATCHVGVGMMARRPAQRVGVRSVALEPITSLAAERAQSALT